MTSDLQTIETLKGLLEKASVTAGAHSALDEADQAENQLMNTVCEWLPRLLQLAERGMRLEAALRDVLSIPALRRLLGTPSRHTTGCNCPICKADKLLAPPASKEEV